MGSFVSNLLLISSFKLLHHQQQNHQKKKKKHTRPHFHCQFWKRQTAWSPTLVCCEGRGGFGGIQGTAIRRGASQPRLRWRTPARPVETGDPVWSHQREEAVGCFWLNSPPPETKENKCREKTRRQVKANRCAVQNSPTYFLTPQSKHCQNKIK